MIMVKANEAPKPQPKTMTTTRTVNRTGPSFLSLLALLFIGLKLGEVISWSWWWVLAPIWGPWALIFGIPLTIALIGGILTGIALAVAFCIDLINKIRKK